MIVPLIDMLIRAGLAYEVPPGYVCLDFAALHQKRCKVAVAIARLRPMPVEYPAVQAARPGCALDCALWAPYVDGNASPWGRGLVTANLAYLRPLLEAALD